MRSTVTELTKAHIRASAIKELTWRGYNVWINNNLAVRGRKFIGRFGVPDVIGISKSGLWVACEVKTLHDRLSDEQIKFLNDIKNAGGFAFIALQVGSQVEVREWEVQQRESY